MPENLFMVGATSTGSIQILRPPVTVLSKAEALNLAAWIVALADDHADRLIPPGTATICDNQSEFAATLAAVLGA